MGFHILSTLEVRRISMRMLIQKLRIKLWVILKVTDVYLTFYKINIKLKFLKIISEIKKCLKL